MTQIEDVFTIPCQDGSKLTLEAGNKIKSYLGLAQKAGKLLAGDNLVYGSVTKKTAKLIVIAADTSPKVAEELNHLLLKAGSKVPVLIFGDKLELGLAVGKSRRGLLALLDAGFAKAILKTVQGNLE